MKVSKWMESHRKHSMHEIVVGNVGTVYNGNSESNARANYDAYVFLSQSNSTRSAGESVTWFQDGEVHREYIGTVDQALDSAHESAVIDHLEVSNDYLRK